MAKMIEIACTCPFCGKVTEIAVDSDALYDYRCGGALVQDAFPTLSASERELIKTGMCQTCQDNIFGVDDDEDDGDLVAQEFDLGGDGELWEEEFDDCDCEEGFDPYCGCFTFDC